jgi:hypothetical protein
VANLQIMANEQKREAGRWSGDEVERRPSGEAEQAAARAEGRSPPAAGRDPGGASSEDEADTVDAHGEDEPARHRPGHGKL